MKLSSIQQKSALLLAVVLFAGMSVGIVRAETYLGCGYDVIRDPYVRGSDVKVPFPVLNKGKMVQDGLIDSIWVGEQEYSVFSTNSLSEFYDARNEKLGLGLSASVPFKGVLFSAGAEAEFNVTLSENRIDNHTYVRGRSYHRGYRVYLRRATAESLKKYLDEGFIADLRSLPAAKFLNRYGSHVFTQYFKGGALEYSFAYYGDRLTTDSERSKALSANLAVKIPGVSFGGSVSSSLSQDEKNIANELNQRSEFRCRSYGGALIDFSDTGKIKSNYDTWVKSMDTAGKADICGIGKFDESLIPVWELAAAIGEFESAWKLEHEFYERANRQRDDMQTGRFIGVVRDTTLIYNTSGTYNYPFNKGVPQTLDVYLLGAGGGGQGGHRRVQWFGIGPDRIGSGGCGGGGAAAYMKLVVPQSATSLQVKVGSGGSGGTGNYVFNDVWESGNPGYPGGNTSILVGPVTLSAEGGSGGGGTGREDLRGGSGGLPSSKPAGLLEFGTAAGLTGGAGEMDGESGRRGGYAATIPAGYGPWSPFGGGSGAKRNGVADAGGGGFGGYHSDQSGGRGGDGRAVVVVTYPDAAHTLMFNTIGGSPVSPITDIPNGARIASPADPTRSGYTFNGWYRDRTTTSAFDFNEEITNTATLYAGWAPNTYTLNFDVDAEENGTIKAMVDGSAVAVGASVEYGKSVIFTATPAAGYVVSGWRLNDAAVTGNIGTTYIITDISEDAFVTVSFAKTYQITFDAEEDGTLSAAVDGNPIATGAMVEQGKNIVLTATPAMGCIVSGWTVNGEKVDGNTKATYTIKDISESVSVTVSFAKTVSVTTPDRTVHIDGEGSVATPAPVPALCGELTVGPNPVSKSSDAVNFFRQGSRIENALLLVYDASGNVAGKVTIKDTLPAGDTGRRIVGSWNLKDTKGRQVSEGTYLVKGVVKVYGGKRELVLLNVGVVR